MPTTSLGLTYPASTGHTRIWEHVQTLAENVNSALTDGTKDLTINDLTLTGNLSVSGLGAQIRKVKTSDQSVTSSTTFVNETALSFTMGTSQTWDADWVLYYSADATLNMKLTMTFPTGTTCTWGYQGYKSDDGFFSAGFAAATPVTSFFILGGNGSANTLIARVTATLVTAGTAGDCTLQFAQSSSSATASTILNRSRLIATRLA